MNGLSKKLKTGLQLRTILMKKDTEELFTIIEISSSGYIVLDSLENDNFTTLLSFNQLIDYSIGGTV